MSWRAPLLLGVTLILGILALTGTFAGTSGFTLRANFADAAGLRSEFFVRIDGVDVGHVTSVTVSPQYTAIVTMHIDASALPIGRNATATIRPDSFFGEHYVAIDPGNTEDPAPSGMTIPLHRTSTNTELDQLFDTFDPQTRLALGVFLSETGEMLVGRGRDLAATLAMLPGTLSDAQTLISNLGADNRVIGDLVDRSSEIVGAIAPQRAALGRLVDNAAAVLAATARRNQDLQAAITDAPQAISRLRTSLTDLQSAAAQLGPAASGLRASAAPLTRVLEELPGFAGAAKPALGALTAAAPLLTELAQTAAPVIARVEAPTRDLATFSKALAPVSNGLSLSLQNLLGYMEGYARAMQDEDLAGHLYRPAQTYYNLGGESLMAMAMAELRSRRHDQHHRGVGPLLPVASLTAPVIKDLGTLSKVLSGTTKVKPLVNASTPLADLLHYLLGP
jgi:phospholipid/cholesterol/gamma-HCH transport system substrate-binding protein